MTESIDCRISKDDPKLKSGNHYFFISVSKRRWAFVSHVIVVCCSLSLLLNHYNGGRTET